MTQDFWVFLFGIVLAFGCLLLILFVQYLFDEWGLTKVKE